MSGITNATLDGFLTELRAPVCAARRLLDALRIDSFEDMEDLAERAGFRVEYVESLPARVSGFPDIDKRGHRFIAVNANKHPEHQAYTILHEMGHHVLGHKLWVYQRDPKLEFDANLFASTLLFHYHGKVSIASHERNNSDVASMMFAPFIFEYLPQILDVIEAGACVLSTVASWLEWEVKKHGITPRRCATNGAEE